MLVRSLARVLASAAFLFSAGVYAQSTNVAGALSKGAGQFQFDGNGACYFSDFCDFKQQGPGAVTLTGPLPGTLGNLAQTVFTGPRFFNPDASLAKDLRISERSLQSQDGLD